MSVRDDSGVSSNSTTPAVSPRVDVLNSLCNSNEPQMNPEIIQQLLQQQAVQRESPLSLLLVRTFSGDVSQHADDDADAHGTRRRSASSTSPPWTYSSTSSALSRNAENDYGWTYAVFLGGDTGFLEISYPNPATIAQQQFLWHQMMVSHMHRMQLLHKEVTERQKSEPAKQVPKEERPLDLSRKSVSFLLLEVI